MVDSGGKQTLNEGKLEVVISVVMGESRKERTKHHRHQPLYQLNVKTRHTPRIQFALDNPNWDPSDEALLFLPL